MAIRFSDGSQPQRLLVGGEDIKELWTYDPIAKKNIRIWPDASLEDFEFSEVLKLQSVTPGLPDTEYGATEVLRLLTSDFTAGIFGYSVFEVLNLRSDLGLPDAPYTIFEVLNLRSVLGIPDLAPYTTFEVLRLTSELPIPQTTDIYTTTEVLNLRSSLSAIDIPPPNQFTQLEVLTLRSALDFPTGQKLASPTNFRMTDT